MNHVLIDGSLYTFAPSGGAYYFLNELLAGIRPQPDIQFQLITLPGKNAQPESTKRIETRKTPLSLRSLIPNGLIKETLRPLKNKLDAYYWRKSGKKGKTLFHSVAYYPFPDRSVPMLTMVHDLIAEKFPEFYEPGVAHRFRAEKEKCILNSVRYIAVSEQSKRDLMEVYSVPSEKIDVIYHGVNKEIFNLNGPKMTLEAPYFLHVGGRLNHKNFEKLAEGFVPFSKDYLLVATGFAWEEKESVILKKLGIHERVRLYQNPSSKDLAALYRGCTGFVFPSLYEGFGMPLVEAMACGAPMAASHVGPFPEIAGQAALYFNPQDSHSISQAMEALLLPKTQENLKRIGLERVKSFTWETAVVQTLESYRKAFKSL